MKLFDLRTNKGYTLRQVEEATGISNAYLSQLENEKIKSPSMNVLYKLSVFYKIDLEVFLIECGFVEKGDATRSLQSRVSELEKRISEVEKQLFIQNKIVIK